MQCSLWLHSLSPIWVDLFRRQLPVLLEEMGMVIDGGLPEPAIGCELRILICSAQHLGARNTPSSEKGGVPWCLSCLAGASWYLVRQNNMRHVSCEGGHLAERKKHAGAFVYHIKGRRHTGQMPDSSSGGWHRCHVHHAEPLVTSRTVQLRPHLRG